MKQTAIEWLIKRIWKGEPSLSQKILIEQAKELEREQICQGYKEGAKKRFNTMLIKREEINKSAETYYTETYK